MIKKGRGGREGEMGFAMFTFAAKMCKKVRGGGVIMLVTAVPERDVVHVRCSKFLVVLLIFIIKIKEHQ